jgi:hypothetical protein
MARQGQTWRWLPLPLVRLLQSTFAHPQRLYGAAIMRILLGASMIVVIVGNYGDRRLLWGPSGVSPVRRFSLLDLANTPVGFEALLGVSLGVVVGFTVFGGRVLALGFGLVVWSLHNRNPLILDGGANLLQLVALVLPLMITNAHWSPSADHVQRRLGERSSTREWLHEFAIHNAAMAIVLFQVAVVYLTAGLWKVAGEVWRHGIALDIVAASERFGLVRELHGFMAIPLLVTAGSYLTVFAQLAFVPLVLTRRPGARLLAVSMVATMHAGIVTIMGLVSFGVAMLGADAAFLTDSDYKTKLRGAARLTLRRVSNFRPAASQGSTDA